MTAAVLRALIGAWSERWHALTAAAEAVADPAERARLLAMAEGIETCDMDARRAARGAGGWTS
jgi:hypothetical protein